MRSLSARSRNYSTKPLTRVYSQGGCLEGGKGKGGEKVGGVSLSAKWIKEEEVDSAKYVLHPPPFIDSQSYRG